MEKLSDAQIPCGEVVGAELISMLEDLAAACRGRKGPIKGVLVLEPDFAPDVDWGPVFRNFSEIIATSLLPQVHADLVKEQEGLLRDALFPGEDFDPIEARERREDRERERDHDEEKNR